MGDPSAADLLAAFRALPGAEALLRAIEESGLDGHLVGGAVRDLWRGGAPVDLDVAIVGDVAPVARRLGADVRAHDRFGTASVAGPDGVRYDLARARSERYGSPGALPDVAPAGIDDDLARRDFTVNATALGLSGADAGRLRTVDGALDDLGAGRLRILHERSFHDDPTRLLRLARYAGRLGFTVAPETVALVAGALDSRALATVSAERIGHELVLLDPSGWEALRALGIDGAIGDGFGLAGADVALARRALALLPADGDPVALLLGLALEGMEDPGWVADLGLPAARRDVALAVARDAPRLAGELASARSLGALDAVVARAPVEAVAVAAASAGDAAIAGRVTEWLRDGRRASPAIDGRDLIAAGVAPGPAIAAGLAAARAAHLDGRADTREAQLAEALRAASGHLP